MSFFSRYIKYFFVQLGKAVMRKKSTADDFTAMSKSMNMFDVTLISIGTSFGLGTYVFIGSFTKNIGPAILLCHMTAAGVSFLSAVCYAEFAERIPSSGGAYTYAYYLIGEVMAMTIGWLLCFEDVIGPAATARALSDIIDDHLGRAISDYFRSKIEFSHPLLGPYPDLLAFAISITILCGLSLGMKEATRITNLLVLLNLCLLLVVILVSGSLIDFSNWNLSPPSKEAGQGGFMPYGWVSLSTWTPYVMFVYIGFDAATHAGAEVKEPERVIPSAVLGSVLIVMVLHFSEAATTTLIWPYYDQKVDRPIQHLMHHVGMDLMSWILEFGIPVCLISNLICGYYPLSRLVYAIADDGLFFKYMSRISFITKSPLNALYTSGFVSAVAALLFDKIHLAEMTCLGTLMTFNLMAMSIIIIRYRDDAMDIGGLGKGRFEVVFNLRPTEKEPTFVTATIVRYCSWFLTFSVFPFHFFLKWRYTALAGGAILETAVLAVCLLAYATVLVVIASQPQSSRKLNFKVKPVPLLPFITMHANAFMGVKYTEETWIRILIWLALGILLYLLYGLWHSKQRIDEEDILNA